MNAPKPPGPSQTRLILASASPRRRDLLGALGVEFEVVVPDVQELAEGDPELLVLENARRKALAARRSVAEVRPAGGGVTVLGVDTEVVLDGRALGKAADRNAARTRLEALSGRTHAVLSGVVVIGGDRGSRAPHERSGVSRTEVTFRTLDSGAVERYLDSEEWRDRAGAYAIQGLGSGLIERVEGDFSNVVGLPLGLLEELLAD
jgi:nucleoside triphosphate pyrophosphatase